MSCVLIDIETFLTQLNIIPLQSGTWHHETIVHYPDEQQAETLNQRIEEIRNMIPSGTGGIYAYFDCKDDCIYVGKSAKLRDRFRTHYRRANRRDPNGDRNDKHFNFWNSRCGELQIYWFEIELEVDRKILEIMLEEHLRPKFVFP